MDNVIAQINGILKIDFHMHASVALKIPISEHHINLTMFILKHNHPIEAAHGGLNHDNLPQVSGNLQAGYLPPSYVEFTHFNYSGDMNTVVYKPPPYRKKTGMRDHSNRMIGIVTL